jgi:3'-phosphoadenosine 5'-phosphosulfate sulfotransferase (PAPS reductase)/FAD synthetase
MELLKRGLLILVSGGRSSAMMARHIQTSSKYDDYEKVYVFCNTGQERPETIQFLKDIVFHWQIPLNIIEGVYSQVPGIGVKSKLVDFDTMDMSGRVYSEAIAHMNKLKNTGVPCAPIPYCSEYMKTRPAHHFAKMIFGTTKYIKAIGYRKEDIPKRITHAELREDKKRIAPLLTDFETVIGLYELSRYFKAQPFQLRIKSTLGNCELCWKKSERNIIESIQYGTRFIDWHREQENKYGNRFFRNNLSIDDLVLIAKNATESGTQLEMFEDVSGDLCVCNF